MVKKIGFAILSVLVITLVLAYSLLIHTKMRFQMAEKL